MPTYLADALYFTTTEDQDFTIYEGVRRISATTDDATFNVGEDIDDDAEFYDETVNLPINPDDNEFGAFRYLDNPDLPFGIYLELTGDRGGDDGFFDDIFGDDEGTQYTYRILAEGTPLPIGGEDGLRQGEAIDDQFPALQIDEVDLDPTDTPYAEDESVQWAAIQGFELAREDEGGIGDQPLTRLGAENVALLYAAALDRQPDVEGLNFWIDQREAGLGSIGLAEAFIQSPEFESQFGQVENIGDGQYVDLLYQNVLERPADGQGAAYWTDQLATGALDEAELLYEFATSAEARAAVPYEEDLTMVSEGQWAFA